MQRSGFVALVFSQESSFAFHVTSKIFHATRCAIQCEFDLLTSIYRFLPHR